MSKRKEVTEWVLGLMNTFRPGNENVATMRKFLESKSDKEFEALMLRYKNREEVIPYYNANLKDKDPDMLDIKKVGDKLGIEFFQRIWITDPITNIRYLTPERYLIVHLPIRRQAQHIDKKKSVVEDSNHIDSLTGQATGVSKTSRLSLPEIMNLESLGLNQCIDECINPRGGNELAFREAKRSMYTSGRFSLQDVESLGSRPTATITLKAFFRAMHIDNNL